MSNGKIVVGVKKTNPDAAPNTGKGLRAEKLLESEPDNKLFGIDMFKFSASDAPFAGLKPPEKKEFLANGSRELMKLSCEIERTAFISIANEAVEMKKIADLATGMEWVRLFSASAAKASGLGAILNVVYESTK